MSQAIQRHEMHSLRLVTALLVVAPAIAWGAAPVDYEKQVKPILTEHCYACHGPLAQKGSLRLDTARFILKGGESGAVVEPGKSDSSLLIERAASSDAAFRMPPEDAGKPLSEEKIAVLKAWVEEGAIGPTDEKVQDPRAHWAYVAPIRAKVPVWLDGASFGNPIDAFLSAARARQRLTTVPRAEKEILLRRAYLDLIGIPPTRDELHAFLADSSPRAFDELVDRLLASPHYGERWARHWMDIWRYTDWFGLGGEVRYSQKHLWHWRDWIVDALQADKGYDRMIVEMLAGDEVAPADPQTLRATGFLTRNWYLFNRNYWLDDVVSHSSRALLGMTFNCARCHAHKYDPISQEDYYRLRAFFEPHKVRLDPLGDATEVKDDGLSRAYDAELETPTYLFIRGDEKNPDKNHPLTPGVPSVLPELPASVTKIDLPLDLYYPGFAAAARSRAIAGAELAIKAAREGLRQREQQLSDLRKKQESAVAEAKAPRLVDEAQKAETDSASSAPVPTDTDFVVDDFSKPRPDVWEMVAGDWHYMNKLLQKAVEQRQSRLITVKNHPRDFYASMRFKIVDGGTRSVGMIFDVADDCLSGVYASPSVSKSQLYHIVKGQEIYPSDSGREAALENNREYELAVAVRDRLVNVWLDGKLQFVCHLAQERREGRFALTAYDAVTEFIGVKVAPLKDGFALATSVDANPKRAETATGNVTKPDLVTRAELEFTIAQKKLLHASSNLPAIQARLAAETSRHVSHAANHEELAFAASQAERQAKYFQAEADVATARKELFDVEHPPESEGDKKPEKKDPSAANAAAKQKLEKAEKQLEESRKSLENPSREYSSFGPVYPSSSSGRRLALAQWIARRDNPLTARVAVNHIWARHFGEPLVGSMFDFGLRTPQPLHHELLDWLAVEFMESGWSMKHLHRLIMTSMAYQMRSATALDDPNLDKDPDNLYLWRMNPRRMEAEIIRDSVLAVSGQLNRSLGGPDLPVESAETTFRRTLYYRYARHDHIKFLTMFDPPSVEECYRRPSSIVPQQALAMQNSKLLLMSARQLAETLTGEIGDKAAPTANAAFLVAAFEQVLGRAPTPEEAAVCESTLKELATIAENESIEGSPVLRARENLIHVLLNHNEFVTIR